VRRVAIATAGAAIIGLTSACATSAALRDRSEYISPAYRQDAIRRAQVWMRTDVPSMDLRTGPGDPGAFAPDELVACAFVEKTSKGNSPKFTCAIKEHDQVKVKYGVTNGEVYAEVAATRLLWALGFGADHMYPVRVECHGCPARVGKRHDDSVLVDPAAIERKMPGRAIETAEGSGWAWPELDLVDESAGGAPRAHRDALRLLAAVLQHTDSKAEQQRLACLPEEGGTKSEKKKERKEERERCPHPFMMIDDTGQTFGQANLWNRNAVSSVNFDGWSQTRVWSDPQRCIANIPKSATGTLDQPLITEAGRAFLADLLRQLSDAQLHDLFDVARFERRSHHNVDEWIAAFKRKREEIAGLRCPA
jgi:hypothetical protein